VNTNRKLKRVRAGEHHWCSSMRRKEPNGNWRETIYWDRKLKILRLLRNFSLRKINYLERMRRWELNRRVVGSTCLVMQQMHHQVIQVNRWVMLTVQVPQGTRLERAYQARSQTMYYHRQSIRWRRITSTWLGLDMALRLQIERMMLTLDNKVISTLHQTLSHSIGMLTTELVLD
jgi:hypothetical protein